MDTSSKIGAAIGAVVCYVLAYLAFAKVQFCFSKNGLESTFIICPTWVGVVLIVQPEQLACLVRGGCVASSRTGALQYYGGAALALSSAAVAGLLPVAVRKSKEVHWTTVEHVYAALPAAAGNPPAGAALLPDPCCVRRRAAGRPA